MNKKVILTIALLVFVSMTLYAQKPYDLWKTLKDIQIKTKYDSEKKYQVDIPVFGNKVKALDGKTVVIKGYLIPIEAYTKQGFFILSALPYNLCYFCGGAGPETVMEVTTKQKVKYSDKPIVLKGRLKLNAQDPDHLMYRLQNAVIVR